jgi:hypothetical protein
MCVAPSPKVNVSPATARTGNGTSTNPRVAKKPSSSRRSIGVMIVAGKFGSRAL